MKRWFVPALLWCAGLALTQPRTSHVIVQVDLDDVVHPVSAQFVREGIQRARAVDANAVLIRINTPGGLSDSMREIVEAMLASPVPIITWVGPNGARAASAGFFVLLAGDLAVMSPATNTGAAHPVGIGGAKFDEVMEKKVVNDAAAYIRSYSAKRGRNAQLAEAAVTESRSFTAEEALKEKLIDAVVADAAEIVSRFHGQSIRRFDDRQETLDLQGARIEVFEMTARERLMSGILNPNVALVLALIGLVGLYIEITHPGLILPGVAGAICLVLGLFAFNLLPVNWAGVLLILLAIALFVLEATVVSHGILALGGIVAMIVGGLMLVEGPIPQLRIHFGTVLAITLPVAGITVFLVRLVYRSHKRKSRADDAGLIGERGYTRSTVFHDGRVLVRGELWRAFSSREIPEDTPVRVVRVEGLRVEVEPEREA